MNILVDTNVISDVVHGDHKWGSWAMDQMIDHFGKLVISPIIFAELCCRVSNSEELDHILAPFKLIDKGLAKDVLFLAANAFLIYLK